MGFLMVFLGAGIGGVLRQAVSLAAARMLGTGLPYGTFTVNVVGSLIMGFLTGYISQKSGFPQPLRLLLTTGALGGFTTFSTFSLDTAVLWERGAPSTAILYAVGSVVISLIAVFAGLAISRALFLTAQA